MNTEKRPTLTLRSALAWLDDNILLLLSGFLLFFIPVYPKIPLAEVLPGYIVRLRLEDLFIAFAAFVWFIQLIRRKIKLSTPLTVIMTAYLVVGLLSCFSAIYYTQTVPATNLQLEKLFLNWARRVEYFSLFFIMFSAIKKRAQAVWMTVIFVAATLTVGFYGLGQKYFLWPVYSTMNREFSKGLQLYLTPHARVQSTFGGQYDFGAFLVMALPILLVLSFYVKKIWIKIVLGIGFLVGLWGLMMTSSRSSFLAYVAAVTLLMILLAFRKGIWWSLKRLIVIYVITALFFMYFGDLLDRFAEIFKGNGAFVALQNSVTEAKKITEAPVAAPPKNSISIDDMNKAAIAAAQKQDQTTAAAVAQGVINQSDTMPAVAQLPPDVYDNIPAAVIATRSASGKEINVVIPRVFSDNAKLLGLSAAIRLDTLWPFAIRGFLRNPALGSGYSTLTKYTNDEFTEAESTDNDFLRTLGETGALGFITFYGIMVIAMIKLWKDTKTTEDELTGYFAMVFTAMTIGLFVNAVYIDVFVSSKIAETYWALAGIMLAYGLLPKSPKSASESTTVKLHTPAPAPKRTTFSRSKRKNA
jgi:hypothetical protein